MSGCTRCNGWGRIPRVGRCYLCDGTGERKVYEPLGRYPPAYAKDETAPAAPLQDRDIS